MSYHHFLVSFTLSGYPRMILPALDATQTIAERHNHMGAVTEKVNDLRGLDNCWLYKFTIILVYDLEEDATFGSNNSRLTVFSSNRYFSYLLAALANYFLGQRCFLREKVLFRVTMLNKVEDHAAPFKGVVGNL